ncbi:MAG: tetratricopeptide repeat-containing sensor histidine kinase [Bacteroidales bacterium]|nr:tetratricopeptide repeat-containing sensor histidine kinase [Bacteroidales bacterium]
MRSHSDPVIDSLFNQLENAHDTVKIDLFNQLSQIYWQRSFDTSLLLADYAVTLAREVNDPVRLGTSLNMKGNAFYLLSNFTKGLEFYQEALHIREELGDSNEIAKTYNNIGAIHLHLQNYNQARDYFERALLIYKGIGDDEVIFSLTNNIGAVHNELAEYEKAYEYFLEAYEIVEYMNDEPRILIALNNLGEVAGSLENYDQALEYFLEAERRCEAAGDIRMKAIVSLNIGSIYMLTGHPDKGLPYLNEALKNANIVNSIQIKRDVYNNLFEFYQGKKDYNRALEYHMLFSDARDSVFSQESRLRVAELELQYNAKSFQSEIEILRRDNEIKRLRITWISISLGSLVLVLILLSVVLYINANRNRIKKEITNLLQEKNRELEAANKKLVESEHNLKDLNATKDKFFSIIGHDLRNPLNALIGFSELIAANSREFSKEDIHRYSVIINESAKNIHQLIENLLNWSRAQTGNIDFSPAHIPLSDFVSEIHKVLKINADNKNIRIDIDIPETIKVFADKNLLSTILRNLISNAVKFTTEGGKVFITAEEDNGKILVSVTDTGIGMNQEQVDSLFTLGTSKSTPGTTKEQGTGLGLILCKEFIEMHDGEIWAESEQGKGSTFKFTIPDIKTDK